MSINNQRATERFNSEAPVVIENCQTGELHDGSMYNYSRGGMYVELDYPLKPGSEVRILIENTKNATRSERCLAKTVWCKEIPGAVVLYDYGIGVRYDLDANCSNYMNKFHVIDGGASKNNT
jgi:Tfp pilus assembly protein PilZ